MMKRFHSQRTAIIFIFLFPTLFGIHCNYQHGLHPVPITGISGTIRFVGEWPPETEWTRIVCFSKRPSPDNIVEFISYLKAISDPIPIKTMEHDYVLPLEPGTYEWIVVAWKAKNAPITDIHMLGEYKESPTDTIPAQITVVQDSLLQHIDILADFALLKTPTEKRTVPAMAKRNK